MYLRKNPSEPGLHSIPFVGVVPSGIKRTERAYDRSGAVALFDKLRVVVELLPRLPNKRLQGALFPPLGRDVAPVGAGVQRKVSGGIRQFVPATQPVRLGLVPLKENPRNAGVPTKPHERPERLRNAPGVPVVPPTGACMVCRVAAPITASMVAFSSLNLLHDYPSRSTDP